MFSRAAGVCYCSTTSDSWRVSGGLPTHIPGRRIMARFMGFVAAEIAVHSLRLFIMQNTTAAVEAHLRHHARVRGDIIRKSRRELGHGWRGRYGRYMVINGHRNFAVDADDGPQALLQRYLGRADTASR